MSRKATIKGGIVIEDIKIGDIHYEYEYGAGMKLEVMSLPVKEERDDDNMWTWYSKNVNTGEVISYGVSDKYSHYGPNLYDYEAYIVKHYI